MKKRILLQLVIACVLVVGGSRAGLAQSADPDDEGEELELGEPEDSEELVLGEDEGVDLGAPTGAAENPDDASGSVAGGVRARASAAASATYPIEQVQRPLTLLAGMSELAVDTPTRVDPFVFNGQLRAKYGVTDEVEIGLRYGTGSGTENGYTVGKALAVDAQYKIKDWVAAQLAVPMFLDPFAIAVSVGAPMKFRFGDKLALVAGRDAVVVRIAKFVPVVEDAAENAALVEAVEINTGVPRGAINAIGGVIYQLDPDLAFLGEIGILGQDFSLQDSAMLLQGTVAYSTSNKVDVGGRVGFADLNDASGSFGVALFAALRI